jgi:hypothetical protein
VSGSGQLLSHSVCGDVRTQGHATRSAARGIDASRHRNSTAWSAIVGSDATPWRFPRPSLPPLPRSPTPLTSGETSQYTIDTGAPE